MSKPRSQVTEFCLLFNPAHKNVCQGGIRRFSHFTALRLKRKQDHCSTRVKSRCPLSALRQAHSAPSCPRDPVTPGGGRPAVPTCNPAAASPGLALPQLSPFRTPTPAATCPRSSPSRTRRPPSPGLPSRLTQCQPCLPGSRTSRRHGSKPAGRHTQLLSFTPPRFASGNDSSSCPPLSPRGAAAGPDLPPARPGGCHIPPATQPREHPRPPPPPLRAGRPLPSRTPQKLAVSCRLLPPPRPAGIPRPRYPCRARSLPSGLGSPGALPAAALPAAGHAARGPHSAPGRRPRRRGAKGGNGSRRGREESRPRRAVPRREEEAADGARGSGGVRAPGARPARRRRGAARPLARTHRRVRHYAAALPGRRHARGEEAEAMPRA